MPGRPPRAERVLQQEPHHVVLGEQLRDRGQVGTADLALGAIDLCLSAGLPELVYPAKRVLCSDHLNGEPVQQTFEPLHGLDGESHLEHWIVLAEDPWQHRRGEPGPDLPHVGFTKFGGELGQFRHCDGLASLVVDKQAVVSQIAGKQHSVPMLEPGLGHEYNHRAHLPRSCP